MSYRFEGEYLYGQPELRSCLRNIAYPIGIRR